MTAEPFKLTKKEADTARSVARRMMLYRAENTDQPAHSIFSQFETEMRLIDEMEAICG